MATATLERGVKPWVDRKKGTATMQVEGIPLNEVRGWNTYGIPEIPPVLNNPNKEGQPRFVEVVGSRVMPKGVPEGSYDQLAMREVVDPTDPAGAVGTVGLLIDRKTGDVLLQSIEEGQAADPGSPASEYVTIRPSLQGSYTNIHEHDIKFSEHADIKVFDKFVQMNPSRIHGPVRVGLVYVDRRDIDLDNNPNYAWFSRKQINQGLQDNAPYNGFLHAALNVYTANHKWYHRLPFFHPKRTNRHEGNKGQSAVAQRAKNKTH